MTASPRGRRRLARARTIRARLAIILAVPTVLLVALAVSGLVGQVRISGRADAAAERVELALTTQELIHSLQRERGLTSGLLGGAAGDRPQVTAQRRTSDQARTALDRLLLGAASGGGVFGGDGGEGAAGAEGADSVRSALEKLAGLGSVRGSVDAGRLTRQEMLDFYTRAITALNEAATAGGSGQSDPSLRRRLEALAVLGEAKEATALERGQLNGVFAQGAFARDDYLRFTEVRAARLQALARFSRLASPDRAAALESILRTPQATEAVSYEQRALAGARGQRLNISADRWWAAMTTVVDDMREVQQGIGADLRERAESLRAQAMRRLAAYGAGAVLTLLIAIVLWLYTFRSIVRPLRALADEANEAALHRLPAAVARIQSADPGQAGGHADPGHAGGHADPGHADPGHADPGHAGPPQAGNEPMAPAGADPHADPAGAGREVPALVRRGDEFAEVALALGQLQRTAVRLASEQALMRRNTARSMASLGRRNQNLVRRQLRFITVLERDEADPGQLANLFELDHLATRMRRNAESLLVLVGEQSPRRASRPVPVGDVLRSAFAEVEDYRRVILRRVDDAAIKGSAAPEIAHLLAELVENALTCSPPDQQVEVQARGTGGEYHIAIVDQGIGMSAEAMETANARLRGEHSFLVAPTRDLGHYVVGRLAERLGIKVWLHDSPLNGVTARVVLPESLLERAGAPQAGEPAPEPALESAPERALERGPGGEQGHDSGSRPMGVVTAVSAEFRTASGQLTPTNLTVPNLNVPSTTGPSTTVPNLNVPSMTGPGTTVPSTTARDRAARDTGAPDAAVRDGAGRTAGTTRNGLVKRQPGATALRRPVRPAAPSTAPPGGPPRDGSAAGANRSPAEVRSMLNDFRSGVHRAERGRSGQTG